MGNPIVQSEAIVQIAKCYFLIPTYLEAGLSEDEFSAVDNSIF